MTRIARFVLRRALYFAPQLFLVTLASFWLIRLLPGNPAVELAGIYSTPSVIADINRNLGLDKPIYQQYVIYLQGLAHGDLGESFLTSSPVSEELGRRVPATLELITAAMLFIVTIGMGLGLLTAMRPRGALARIFRVYGAMSGSFPDFWLGLVLLYVFFFILGWAPPALGRLSLDVDPPRHITGAYTIDALLTGNLVAFNSAASHLVLPVATLVIANMGAIVKITRATLDEALKSDYCNYARACGLSTRTVTGYALKNSLPAILTLIGIQYSFLLAGDVLVENVFSWGGVGSFVVQSVNRSDYFVLQAFVLLSAVFNLGIYLLIDVGHFVIDPRLEF